MVFKSRLFHDKPNGNRDLSPEPVSIVMKIVKMAQHSGEVLVDVSSDGRVTVRAVKEAVSLALKKRFPQTYLIYIVVTLAFILGLGSGVLFDRVVLIDSLIVGNNESKMGSSIKNTVLFSDYLSETLTDNDTDRSAPLLTAHELFLYGEVDAAYEKWYEEIINLPDSAKVIVTGVYSSEQAAFKVYKSLARQYRPILAKISKKNTVQILILVVHAEETGFEETREKLATFLSIPLPKWNNANRIKDRLKI